MHRSRGQGAIRITLRQALPLPRSEALLPPVEPLPARAAPADPLHLHQPAIISRSTARCTIVHLLRALRQAESTTSLAVQLPAIPAGYLSHPFRLRVLIRIHLTCSRWPEKALWRSRLAA